MPYLQMQDASGNWVTVNQDMGMPAGKPKTIAVPLHFISQSRKLRIVTNLCIYWDEIFLSETAAPAEASQQQLALLSADLHFRGFSESIIDSQRKQPDTFLYQNVATTSFWNPTPGQYTKYGDVHSLTVDIDDRLIIMGSGDELSLLFDASKLTPLPSGWTRDFLLKVDGWAKDRDPNTAFSQTVEPLPFHSMTSYPYPATEHFPQDLTHLNYQHDYNTRPALRLVRPLIPQDREKQGLTTLSQGGFPAHAITPPYDAAWTERSVPAFRPVQKPNVSATPPSLDHKERLQ